MKEKDRRPFANGKTVVFTGNNFENDYAITGIVGRHDKNFAARNLNGGGQALNFTVCTEKYSKKLNQVINTWHNVVLYNDLAVAAMKLLRQGRPVRVIGSFITSKYRRLMPVELETGEWIKAFVTTNEPRLLGERLLALGNTFDLNYGVERENGNGFQPATAPKANFANGNSSSGEFIEEDIPGIPYDGEW